MTTIRVYGPDCEGCRREGTHALLQIDGAQHYLSRAELLQASRSLDRAMSAFGTQVEFRAMGRDLLIARTEATRLQEQIDAVLRQKRRLTFDERAGRFA